MVEVEDFIVEKDGKKFIDIMKIMPKALPSGKKILFSELENGLLKISVDKHSARGGNPKPCVINRFILIDENLCKLLGLWFGDGIKVQGGVLKLFGFSNSELSLLKTFLSLSKVCLSIDSSQFNCVISLPSNMGKDEKEIKKRVSTQLQIPERQFWKTRVNPTRTKVGIDIKISSRLLGFTMGTILNLMKPLILQDKKLSSSFMAGVIASEANVHVRKCGRLGGISIAIKDETERNFLKKILLNLSIFPNKDKTREGQESILIHGFSNFQKIKKWDLVSLHPLKLKEFERGLSGFKRIQFRKGEGQLLILKYLSNGPKTRFELASLVDRTPSMVKIYLLNLEKKKLVKRGKKTKDGKRIWKITKEGERMLKASKLVPL